MSAPTESNFYAVAKGTASDAISIPVYDTRIPTTTDVNFPVGKKWINTSSDAVYILTSKSSSNRLVSATWTLLGTSGGNLDTLTGDSGTATPSSNNIQIAGTSGEITTSGSGAVITLALANPMTAPGALTVTGLLTASASATIETAGAALNLGSDNSGDAVNLGVGTVARAINIGTSTAAHTVAIGNGSAGAITVDTAAGISLDAGAASNFTVAGAGIDLTLASGGGRVVVNGEEAAADAIRLLSAAGGLDADVALQMNLTSSQNAADAIRINASAGGIDIDAAGAAGEDINIDNAAGSINLTAGESVSNAIVISASDAAGGITIDAGSAGVNVTGADLDVQGGDIKISGAAQQLQVEGGAVTDFIGQATLVAGTVTVANTNIAATDRIFVTRSDVNSSTALGVFSTSISAATSFTITAHNPADATTQTNDVSIVDYFIVRNL